MATRKVAVKEGTDTLRWGNRIKGMFTIAKGYHLKAGYNRYPETKKGESIWKKKHGRRWHSLPGS